MSFTQEQVKHIANLSRLELKPEEAENMHDKLDSIVGYIDMLANLPDAELAKVQVSNFETLPLREDVVKTSEIASREEMLACSPKKIINHSISISNIMD